MPPILDALLFFTSLQGFVFGELPRLELQKVAGRAAKWPVPKPRRPAGVGSRF